MLPLPAVCEVIELSDLLTGFPGRRPSRPYLCYGQFPPVRIAVVPLSRQQRANSTFRIPAGSADRLHEDSYIVEWPGTVDYFEAVEAPSLGHVRPVDFAEKVLEYIAGVFSA